MKIYTSSTKQMNFDQIPLGLIQSPSLMIGINIASSLKFEISKNTSTILSERKGDPQKNEKDREDT